MAAALHHGASLKNQLQGINAGKNKLDAIVRQERLRPCVGLRHPHSWLLPLVPHLWQLFVSKRCLFPTPFITYCGFLPSRTGTVLAGGPPAVYRYSGAASHKQNEIPEVLEVLCAQLAAPRSDCIRPSIASFSLSQLLVSSCSNRYILCVCVSVPRVYLSPSRSSNGAR